MSYLSLFILSFTIALSGALAPGPILATTIAESARYGFRAGPLLIVGHAFSEILMVALIVLGLGRFLQHPSVIKAVSLGGGLILIYFGSRLLSTGIKTLPAASGASPSSGRSLVLTGFTLSFSNPYWSVWWLTVGVGLLLASRRQGLLAVAVFFAGHILADFFWYALVSWLVHRGRQFFSGRLYQRLIAACGLLLVALGLWFGLRSL